jgi:hypothetical protein
MTPSNTVTRSCVEGPDAVGDAVGVVFVVVACGGVVAAGVAAGVAVGVVVGVVAINATHPNVSSKTTTTRPTAIIFLLKPNIDRDRGGGVGGGVYGGCRVGGLGAADGAPRGGDAAALATVAPQFAQYAAFGRLDSPQFRQYFWSTIISPLNESLKKSERHAIRSRFA